MGRLVRDDRKATVTQITTRYNQGMQYTISETTTHRTLKQIGYSSRRPHRVLLLSAKNRKWRQQFAQIHQNWTIEDWKNVAWSDEWSRFLLRHSMNEWCIYIALYCVLLYTQSTLQSYGVSPPPIWNHSDGRVRIWHKEHERKCFSFSWVRATYYHCTEP